MPNLTPIEEAEAALDLELAALDQTSAQAVAAADAAMDQRASEMATAGSVFDSQVIAADQAVEQGLEEYAEYLHAIDGHLEGAEEAIDAIPETDATEEIEAIGSVSAPAVPTSEAADCSAADVNTALLSFAGQVNTVIDAIVDALQVLNDGSNEKIKEALQKVKDAQKTFRDGLPEATDTEAEKAAHHATIQGLY